MRIGWLTLCSMSGIGGGRSSKISLSLIRKVYEMKHFMPIERRGGVAVDYVFVLRRTERAAIKLTIKICKRKLPEEFKFRINFKKATQYGKWLLRKAYEETIPKERSSGDRKWH